MKVLFLDVDGVLVLKVVIPQTDSYFPPEPLLGLKEIVDNIGKEELKIVLSSTWRCFPELLEYLNEVLEGRGIGSIFSCTPKRGIFKKNRPTEIREWLKDWEEGIENERITHWVCVDDMGFEGESERFVKVDKSVGLSLEDARKIISIFQGPPNHL